MTYEEALKSPQWQRRRLERMAKADWKCERCGDDAEQLHIHHKEYRTWPNGLRVSPWEYDDDLLQCLCETCHTLTHLNQNKICIFAEALLTESQKRKIADGVEMHLLHLTSEKARLVRDIEALKQQKDKNI